MKDLGSLKYFLGIEVLKFKDGILLNQRKSAMQLISEAGLSGPKVVSTPLEFNHKLTSVEFDQHLGTTNDPDLEDITAYQRLIGKLLYLTITRPDICFSLQVLSQFMQHPKVSHREAASRIVRYIKNSPGFGVLLKRGTGPTTLTGYCDFDWASCSNTRRSVTGYIVKLGDSLISWKSKKQQTISRNSAKAEYRSLATLVAELVWLAGLLKELHVPITYPISVFTDSKSAIQTAENPIFHERTKHVEIDCHFIREKVKSNFISPKYLCTALQPAVILTKGLGAQQHHLLLTKLVFQYSPQFHNVMQVKHAEYQSCNASAPIATHTTGKDSITIATHGHHFFLCGVPGHCQAGQKVDINVLRASSSPSPSPSPSSSSSTVPALAVPSPSPSHASYWLPSKIGVFLAVSLVLVSFA
ncbi:Mavicyanin [Capsicum annuum]|nr:Mavicyanin [Capsicum annuum]KAF3666200.1 Mavicyanin [Capsicum annuum]